MKKMLFVCSISLGLGIGVSNAQTSEGVRVETQSWSWNTTTVSGVQTVAVPGGKGVLKFNKQGTIL